MKEIYRKSKVLIQLLIVVSGFVFFADTYSADANRRPSVQGLKMQVEQMQQQLDLLQGRVGVLESTITKCDTNDHCTASAYCKKEASDCSGLGECIARPEVCPDIWDPVCGCDDQTYGNTCEAAQQGVSVQHQGECETACRGNQDCTSGNYCAKAVGDCTGEGNCQLIPDFCPDVWAPVCGCDGNTYGNACEAAHLGINIAHEGACESPPADCMVNGECATGEYCAKTAGDCDGSGSCTAKPEICPDVWAPVCGCDGNTYGNACEAAHAEINIAHEGACESPPADCMVNGECATGEYCAKTPGDCDGSGSCTAKPEFCITLYDPVCGCDGNTYGNACEAAHAGINIAHHGECDSPPADCMVNGECATGEYCAKAPGDCDGSGTCTAKPEICPTLYDPVCGCNDITYANSCVAAGNGVNVDRKGVCSDGLLPMKD